MGDKYCYILDYSDGTVCKITLTEEDKELETEDLLKKYGVNIDECAFMFNDNDINCITDLKRIIL